MRLLQLSNNRTIVIDAITYTGIENKGTRAQARFDIGVGNETYYQYFDTDEEAKEAYDLLVKELERL